MIISKLRIYLVFLSIIMVSSALKSQDVTVKGTITDETNVTMPGVNIFLRGTTLGTVSDINGYYSIPTKMGDTIVFSFLGYKEQEIPVKSEQLNVQLQLDSYSLQEVIAIGYGDIRKKDVTSSISIVTGEEISKVPTRGNFTQSLQGKTAGVQVYNTSGKPGSNPTVIIRGVSSINGDPNPMYVVDGIPVGQYVNQINSQDIENVVILKDASATAIYGTQAADGVILITTKKGKMGEQNFNVNASYGLQDLVKPGIAGAKEYMLVQNEKRFNAGQGEYALFSAEEIDNAKTTDWWDEAMRNLAPVYNLNIGFDGGSKKFRYNVSGGYFRQESQMVVGYWNRFTLRVNTEYHFNDNIVFGQNFYPRVESWKNTPDIWDNISMDPTTPVYIPEDEWAGKNRYSIFQRSYNNDIWNPMGTIERSKVNNNNLETGFGSNTFLDIRFLKDFKFLTQLGLEFSSLMQDRYDPEFVIDLGKESNLVNSVSREVDNYYSFTWNNTLNYIKSINETHNINVPGLQQKRGEIKMYGDIKREFLTTANI